MKDKILNKLYLGFMQLHILYHSKKEPVFGVWMMKELEFHGYNIGPGTLYPILNKMEKNGLLLKEERNVNGKKIYSGFNLEIKEKEKVLIKGPSGCGKTSLFKLLLGFEKIKKGNINFNSLEHNKKNIKSIRSKIFYLSQDIDFRNDIIVNLIEDIYEYELNKSLNFDYDRVIESMKVVGLEDGILKKHVDKLSGGERQRIGLVICFLLDRPVWLLDEPISALDDKIKKK